MQNHLVFGKIDSLILFEFSYQPVNDTLVKVVPAEVSVAISCFNLDNIVSDFQNGDIKRSTTEIIYSNGVVFIFIQTIG